MKSISAWVSALVTALASSFPLAAENLPSATSTSTAAGQSSNTISGYWTGWAERDGYRSDVAIRVFSRADKLAGTVDWPSMGYFRADLLGIKVANDSITFSVPLPVGAVKLVGTRRNESIDGSIDAIGLVKGEWQSLGVSGAFQLRRGNEPVAPYTIDDAAFENSGVRLSGSLFLPTGRSPDAAVVYVAGSGDATRGDGSYLADRLARKGIATLVYDKRGTGQSTGDWRQGGFEELAGDAAAALRWLQERHDIDPKRTGFVCQSQGCWVAPIALRRGAPAHFLVAQSAPTVSVVDEDLDFYSVTLSSQGFGDAEIREAFELVRTSQRVSLGLATWAQLEKVMQRFSDREWFKALGHSPTPVDSPERIFEKKTLGYDPFDDINALRIPTLWIYGRSDTIIPVQACIDRLLQTKPRNTVSIVILPDAGHSFTISEHVIPKMAPEYPDVVVRWLSGQAVAADLNP